MYQRRAAKPHTSIALLLGLVVVLAVGLIFVQTQRLLYQQHMEESAQISQIVIQAQALGEPIAQLCAGSKGPMVARELANTRTPDGQGVCPAAVQLQQLPPSVVPAVPSTRPPNAYEVQRMIDEELARRSLVPIPPALTTPPASPAPSPPALTTPPPPTSTPAVPVPTAVVRPTWSAPPTPTTAAGTASPSYVPRSHRATVTRTPPAATTVTTSPPTTVVTQLPPTATVTQQPPATVTQPAPTTVTTTATAAPVPAPVAPSQGVLPAVGDTVSGLVSGLLGVLTAWAGSLFGRFH